MNPLPYGRQWITEADIQAVTEVLRSDWLTQGPAIDRNPRYATGRGCTPPTKRALSGSPMKAAHPSKSSG